MRQITAAALDLIKRDEGLRLAAYRDVAGIWTVGYGHTPAFPGEIVTEAQATALLVGDVQHAADAVDAVTHDVPTTDSQFSAMVSLAFNIGTGAFKTSTLLRKHRARDYTGAADAFLLWDKAHVNGVLVVVAELLRRRGEERAMYRSADVSHPAPAQVSADIKTTAPASPHPAKPTPLPRPSSDDAETDALNAAERSRLGV